MAWICGGIRNIFCPQQSDILIKLCDSPIYHGAPVPDYLLLIPIYPYYDTFLLGSLAIKGPVSLYDILSLVIL